MSIKLQIVFLSVFMTEAFAYSFVNIFYLVFKIYCFKLRTFTCAHKYFLNVLLIGEVFTGTSETQTWLTVESDHEGFLHNLGRASLTPATVGWKVTRHWCTLLLHVCHLVTVNASFTELTPPTQQKCDCM